MGQFLKLRPAKIKPSQDFLKRDTVDFILQCIQRGKIANLPPTPIVRRDSEGDGYVAIDGHNLLAIFAMLERECDVYLAASAQDFLPNPDNLPAVAKRNQDLLEKFEECLEEARRLNTSFRSLLDGLDLDKI